MSVVYITENVIACLNAFFKKNQTQIFCAYSSDCNALKGLEEYKDVTMTIAALHQELLGFLDDKYKSIENSLMVEEAISNTYTGKEVSYQKVKSMYLNNRNDIASSMKLCIETLINPYELMNNTNYSQELFLNIYNQVIVEDNYYVYISTILNYLYNIDIFENDYKEFLNKNNCKTSDLVIHGFKDSKLVIFVNFEIITPPQMLLIRLLQKAGYTTLFIVEGKYINKDQANKGYKPAVNEIIYSTYKNIADIKYFYGGFSDLNTADVFSALIEGKTDEAIKIKDNLRADNLKFIKFSNKADYAKYINDAYGEGTKIYTLNNKADKNILKAFYGSNVNAARKFEDSSLGRFILNLYNMFNINGTKFDHNSFVKFNENTLLKAFSYNGLCSSGEEYASSYADNLRDLLYWLGPQLNDKPAIEWINALDNLIKNRDKLKLNYLKVPAFQIETHRLNVIKDLFVVIEGLVKLLFIISENEEETVNYTLLEFLEKISILANDENINGPTSENIEELEILKERISDTIYFFSESNVIRNTRLQKNSQLVERIKIFLTSISYESSGTQTLIDSLNNFRDCSDFNFKGENSKILITNFNKFNLSKDSDYTTPFNKRLVKAYSQNIKVEDEYDALKCELINASLNIVNTLFLQNLRAFYLHLKNNKTVELIRLTDDYEDSANYFEVLLTKFFNLKSENLGYNTTLPAKPFKLDFDLSSYKDKSTAIDMVFNRSKNIDVDLYCPRRVFYNTFSGEFIRDSFILENNLARIIYKTYFIKRHPSSININEIKDIISVILPGKSESFKDDVFYMIKSNINNKKSSDLNIFDSNLLKKYIADELDKENLIFDSSSNNEICKKCSANCSHKHI